MSVAVERWRTFAQRPPFGRRVGDVLLAVVVAAAQIAGTFGAAHGQPERQPLDAVAIGLLAVSAVALVARRSHALAVLGVAFTATFAYELLNYPGGPIWFALIVAFFTAHTSGHRRVGFVAIAVGWSSMWWEPVVLGRSAPAAGPAVGFTAWMLVLVAAAEIVRVRRAYRDEAQERAREANHARELEARREQIGERLRIARDLHDVLAHNISLINVQASTALHLLDQSPDQARPALTAIKRASREALAEVRSVLDTLRQADDVAARAPAPTLSGLDDLTAQAAAAGLAITTDIEGPARPLPAAVELAAYRICQEAVTNVIRHAGPATARLRLRYATDELVVEVADDGRGAAADGSVGGGNGLTGMRERAAALDGSLEAGPLSGGGFRVRARLPLDAAP